MRGISHYLDHTVYCPRTTSDEQGKITLGWIGTPRGSSYVADMLPVFSRTVFTFLFCFRNFFAWTFGTLLLLHLLTDFVHMDGLIRDSQWTVLLIATLVGLIPESGPHLIFVMMYAQGLIPFSVLFTTSFVQDGHGMLPLLSYSIKDSILIKAFNLVFGITIGAILFVLGI